MRLIGAVCEVTEGKTEAVERVYARDAVVIGPLGELRGRVAIRAFVEGLSRTFTRLEATAHEAFESADRRRSLIRTHLRFQVARGEPAGGKHGTVALTHALRLREEQVAEHIVGFSTFALPQILLLDRGLPVVEVPEPAPELVSAAPGDAATDRDDVSLARRFTRAFGARDLRELEAIYSPDVRLYTPLGWPISGWEAVANFVDQFHSANPGMRVALHDEFASADGQRICWRIRLHFHNTAPFYGLPPTGDRGEMPETHVIKLSDGRIVRHIVGDMGFQLPKAELVDWKMDFPTETTDPDPPLGR